MIAQTILSQLGGKRFIVMTGSKNFVDHGDALFFWLAKNSSRANRCKITLDANDTYTVEFMRYSKLLDFTPVKKLEGVYCDQLQEVFTSVTGLYTRL